jgi:hypothetical protein
VRDLVPRLMIVSVLMSPKHIPVKRCVKKSENKTYGMPVWSEKEGQILVALSGDGLAGQHPAEPSCLALPIAAAVLEPAQAYTQATLR